VSLFADGLIKLSVSYDESHIFKVMLGIHILTAVLQNVVASSVDLYAKADSINPPNQQVK
jgi:hypothetical protein